MNQIVREEIAIFKNIDMTVQKAVYRWQSALSHPRNFSDFNTNISWITKWIAEEAKHHHHVLQNILDHCLVKYDKIGGGEVRH